MAQAEAPLSKVPWMANHPTNRRLKARSKTVVSVFACKLKALANSRGSYLLADMETSDNTLDHVHSIFVRETTVLAVDSVNGTCTYYTSGMLNIVGASLSKQINYE